MTDKDIQQLIDRYLDGETTPADERLLARTLYRHGRQGGDMPEEWQTIRLMLGELAMGEAEYDEIMSERQQVSHNTKPLRTQHGGRRWRKMAVAASLLLLFGIGATLLFKGLSRNSSANGEPLLAENNPPVQPEPPAPTEEDSSTDDLALHVNDINEGMSISPNDIPQKAVAANTHPADVEDVAGIRTNNSRLESPSSESGVQGSVEALTVETPPKAIYASHTVDTTYQDPAKMNDFIEKLAAYNDVKEVPLECTGASKDCAVISAAYVFPDKEEINLFARLLQAACSYEDTTPGYHLNFTHQQFFFCLDDPNNQRKYLWIAERINGNRILLFKTHSPLGTAVSVACYQDFRNRITHTRFSSLNY